MTVPADMTRATEHVRSMNVLDVSTVSIKTRIAVLWVSATLCYLYGDVIAFYGPGALQKMIDGKLGEWTVTPNWLLGVGVLMSLPAVMVALTVLLKPVVSRWLNVVVGAAMTGASLSFISRIGRVGGRWLSKRFFWARHRGNRGARFRRPETEHNARTPEY